MKNSELPNINYIGNGSEVRAAVAKFIGYIETHGTAASKQTGGAFLITAATRLGGVSGGSEPLPTQALVNDAAVIPIHNSAGVVKGNVTASVSNGTLSAVRMGATTALVANTGTLTVQTSTGGSSTAGSATVAAGVLSYIRLPATSTIVANNQALTVSGVTLTFTVAGGAVTGVSGGTIGTPVNTAAPVITGTAAVGGTQSLNLGTWTGTPTGYYYVWQVSDNGTTGWTAIGSANANTYIATAAVSGKYIRCGIVGVNTIGGSAFAYTAARLIAASEG